MDSSTTITSLDLASSARHIPFDELNDVDADPRFRRPPPLGEAASAEMGVAVAAAAAAAAGRQQAIPSSASVPSFSYLSPSSSRRREGRSRMSGSRSHAGSHGNELGVVNGNAAAAAAQQGFDVAAAAAAMAAARQQQWSLEMLDSMQR